MRLAPLTAAGRSSPRRRRRKSRVRRRRSLTLDPALANERQQRVLRHSCVALSGEELAPAAEHRLGSRAYSQGVPIYDFACPACGEQFEALVAMSEIPRCPACAAPDPRRLFAPIAAARKTGLHGAAARRSDNLRHSRDEQLREGFAVEREARRQSGPEG